MTTKTTTTTEPITQTLEVPGATLTYDVHLIEASTEPPLMIIGSPMAAAGFVTLAGHFADRTVVTYDPRGPSEASRRIQPLSPRRTSTRTTCIGSFRRWEPVRWTSSPPAVAP